MNGTNLTQKSATLVLMCVCQIFDQDSCDFKKAKFSILKLPTTVV